MLYIITFDIKDALRSKRFTQQLSNIGEHISFLPKSYFLKTNTEISRNEIYTQLKSVLEDEDLFLVADVNLRDMSGWLSSSAVDWLKNK